MEFQPSFSVSGLPGQPAVGDGGPEADRLGEAATQVRRTRLRLEEIADRLSRIRERVQAAAELGRPALPGQRASAPDGPPSPGFSGQTG